MAATDKFAPCGHAGISRATPSATGGTDIVCGLCFDLYQSTISRWILAGHILVLADAEHPYYGPDTILRLRCSGSGKSKNPCARDFYLTIADSAYCSESTPNPKHPTGFSARYTKVLDCAQGHQSDGFPIYKVLVAVEYLFGRRADFNPPKTTGALRAYGPVAHDPVSGWTFAIGGHGGYGGRGGVRNIVHKDDKLAILDGEEVDSVWSSHAASASWRFGVQALCGHLTSIVPDLFLSSDLMSAGERIARDHNPSDFLREKIDKRAPTIIGRAMLGTFAKKIEAGRAAEDLLAAAL